MIRVPIFLKNPVSGTSPRLTQNRPKTPKIIQKPTQNPSIFDQIQSRPYDPGSKNHSIFNHLHTKTDPLGRSAREKPKYSLIIQKEAGRLEKAKSIQSRPYDQTVVICK
jgi:hypothetical protein